MEEEEHLTYLTRCIKCGKKIEMHTYFCNSTCDDQFIKEKEKDKDKDKDKR
jgi:predicted nucleic acid-binding Zn ribbon protein